MPADPLTLTIVTPCLNAETTIRRAIDSVLGNDSATIRHIIVDGGSSDRTREILREYAHLTIIEGDDDGPYDAINRGFAHANGDILAWLNADDFYLPHALDVVLAVFGQCREIDWLTTRFPLFADASGGLVHCTREAVYSRARSLRPDSPRLSRAIPTAMQQESTFWRRSLWEACGAQLDTRFKFAADFDLWLRFWQVARLDAVSSPLGCFRWTDAQRSRAFGSQYREEVSAILREHESRPAGTLRTIGRRAALAARGLPQGLLKYCPFAHAQHVVSFDRATSRWQITQRYGIPE